MKRFTEAEYVADRATVIRHAIDSGETVAVIRPDGSARVVISVPKADQPPVVRHCENDFRRWAKHDPARLIAALTDGSLPPTDLTFAAEIAGQLTEARDSLLSLLDHESAVVREGAVYGLSSFVSDPAVRDRLYQLSCVDPSPAVAMSAAEALED